MNVSGFMADTVQDRTDALVEQAMSLLPEKTDLCYVQYDDHLMDEQIHDLFDGLAFGEVKGLDEFEFESRWYGLQYELDELKRNGDFDDEEMDLIVTDQRVIDAIYDRDESDPLRDLISHTPDRYMRYWMDERDLDTDELLDRISIGVEGVGEVLDALGLLGTDQHTPELEQEIADILANSGTDVAIYIFWSGPIDDLIEAAAWDYGEGAPKQTITWENPGLLLYHPFYGNGFEGQIHCTITTEFNKSNLALDAKGGRGYSYSEEVAGLMPRAYDTNVTITREDTKHG